MPVARSGDLKLTIGAAAAMVALSIVSIFVSPPGPDGLPGGSSFSTSADGTSAAFQTLQRLGYSVARTIDPMTSLKAPRTAVLFIIDPIEPASAQDRRAVQAFIAGGGTVLATGCGGASFLADAAPTHGTALDAHVYDALTASPLSLGVPHIRMGSDCEASLPPHAYVPLYGDAHHTAVQVARIGEGAAIWWSASTPLTNRGIEAPGHLALLLNVVGTRGHAVVWDEYYHGQRRSIWSYAAGTPLPWALAQIGLAAAVAAAMFVRRRQPVRARALEPRTSPLEFVETMAGLYERARAARAAASMARAHLRRQLLDVAGGAADVTDERLAAVVAQRLSIDSTMLAAALAEADRLASTGSATPGDVLPVVKRLQGFGAIVERSGRQAAT